MLRFVQPSTVAFDVLRVATIVPGLLLLLRRLLLRLLLAREAIIIHLKRPRPMVANLPSPTTRTGQPLNLCPGAIYIYKQITYISALSGSRAGLARPVPINERTDGRMDGRTDGRTEGWMGGRMIGRKDERTEITDRRTDYRMEGRTHADGRTDGRTDCRMD